MADQRLQLLAALAAVVERAAILAQEALAAQEVPLLAGMERLELAVLVAVVVPHTIRQSELPLVEAAGGLDCLGQALLGLVDWGQLLLLLGLSVTLTVVVVALVETLGLPSYPQHKISTIQ
jgi:hypothetical protein